jgi:hypothetical protein
MEGRGSKEKRRGTLGDDKRKQYFLTVPESVYNIPEWIHTEEALVTPDPRTVSTGSQLGSGPMLVQP